MKPHCTQASKQMQELLAIFRRAPADKKSLLKKKYMAPVSSSEAVACEGSLAGQPRCQRMPSIRGNSSSLRRGASGESTDNPRVDVQSSPPEVRFESLLVEESLPEVIPSERPGISRARTSDRGCQSGPLPHLAGDELPTWPTTRRIVRLGEDDIEGTISL